MKLVFRRGVVAALSIAVLTSLTPVANAQQAWHIAKGPLLTRWSSLVSPTNALPEYPRPQLARDNWQNLNGLWDYAITDIGAASIPNSYDGQILVPFPVESALSGVMKAFLPTQRLWYHRTFTVPNSWSGQRVLLHFGAVDWEASVLVNGHDIGSHQGGYDAFSYDITENLHPGTNEITVSVVAPLDSSWELRGKQTLHPGGAAYTAASGIWQTVWIEPVPTSHIEDVHYVTDAAKGVVHLIIGGRITPTATPLTVTVSDGANVVATVAGALGSEITPEVYGSLVTFYKATSTYSETTLDIPIPKAHFWTPEDPFLYQVTITLNGKSGSDTVHSYFGLRSLSIGKDTKGNMRLYVNGKVTMLPMVLDQGYWPDGIYTAPTDDALRFDLEAEKQLGVDVRKHVKVEPDRWYYWADKLGVLVLQDMPTGNEGDPFTDRPTSPEAAAQCKTEMGNLIQQRWNHPSIISWNMFNEGWGQHDTIATANWAKQFDPTRLIDEASGFPWHGAGDIRDCHGGVPPKSDRAISIDTEDGSVGLRTPGHDWPIGDLWTPVSYDPATGGMDSHPTAGKFAVLDDDSKTWFTKHVRSMYRGLWSNTDDTGQTGDSYCQITDVETEEDGLISYDRSVWKVDPAPIRAAALGQTLARNIAILIPSALTQPTRWQYTTVTPGVDWFKLGYQASEWKSGLSAFGSGYGHIGTPWTDTPGDIWLRKEFTLAETPKSPLIRMIHDEDVEVYINGILACNDGGYISGYDDFDINPKAAATLHLGKNLIAVHCHQTAGGQVIDVGMLDRKTGK